MYFGVIDTQAKAVSLSDVPKKDAECAKEVQRVNREAGQRILLCSVFSDVDALSCNQDQVDQTLDS